MTLTLDATVGGVSANSYVTMDEATAYFAGRSFKDAWLTASASQKTTALVWAARTLDDQIEWLGVRTASAQALEWPRYGVADPRVANDSTSLVLADNVVPQNVKDAQCELALSLLTEDRTADPGGGLSAVTVGPLSINYSGSSETSPKIIPRIVRTMVTPYADRISGGGMVPLRRA